MKISAETLYNLLPAVYRIRDSENGESLKAFIEIIASQAIKMEDDIANLYNNWFIETCKEWVVPYIGDMMAVKGLYDLGEAASFSQRARVANTIAYRRRKGTATMLEQLAYDTTGWRAHVTEFFKLLETTQYANHIRPLNLRTPDIRKTNELELIDSPFDTAAHTGEVRNISKNRGYYNIPDIGIYLWRLQSYFIEKCTARDAAAGADGGCYYFSQLGMNIRLFNRPQTEEEIFSLSGEINVPGLLRRRPLYDELIARRQYRVDNQSDLRDALTDLRDAVINVAASVEPEILALLAIVSGGGTALYEELKIMAAELSANFDDYKETALEIIAGALNDDFNSDGIYFGSLPVFEIFVKNAGTDFYYRALPEEIFICNMGDPDDESSQVWKIPAGGIAVDPVLGRLAFPDGIFPEKVLVSYAYGFSGDSGGGPYNKNKEINTKDISWKAVVSKTLSVNEPGQVYSSLLDALEAWNDIEDKSSGLIVVADNFTYDEDISDLKIIIAQASRLQIISAKLPVTEANTAEDMIPLKIRPDELRPHVKSDINISGSSDDVDKSGGELILEGLLVEGKVKIRNPNNNRLGYLEIHDCTVTEGISSTLDELELNITRSISGPLDFEKTYSKLSAEDSIIIKKSAARAINGVNVTADIQKCTVIGNTEIQTLYAGNSIFTGKINTIRLQQGCIRYSYYPEKSIVPKSYYCQPELALKNVKRNLKTYTRSRLIPVFTSGLSGNHAFSQLSVHCADEIRKGADDGSEMGAFSFLKNPQREINLRTSLDEYLRAGLEAGLIFVT